MTSAEAAPKAIACVAKVRYSFSSSCAFSATSLQIFITEHVGSLLAQGERHLVQSAKATTVGRPIYPTSPGGSRTFS